FVYTFAPRLVKDEFLSRQPARGRVLSSAHAPTAPPGARARARHRAPGRLRRRARGGPRHAPPAPRRLARRAPLRRPLRGMPRRRRPGLVARDALPDPPG